jgi:hypothetical protein
MIVVTIVVVTRGGPDHGASRLVKDQLARVTFIAVVEVEHVFERAGAACAKAQLWQKQHGARLISRAVRSTRTIFSTARFLIRKKSKENRDLKRSRHKTA